MVLYRDISFQDTLISGISVIHDSTTKKIFSVPDTAKIQVADTSTICSRNKVADITFHDPDNFVNKIESEKQLLFPYLFIAKNKEIHEEQRATLVKHLKEGANNPQVALHQDWMMGIILLSAFLFLLVKTTSSSTLPTIKRIFLFRGLNDTSSREISGIFYWQSTILNLISFLVIGLFVYCAASYFSIIPTGIKGIIFWLLSIGVVITAVTLRHFVCILTGNISGQRDVFREYLANIYLFYKFYALFLFINIVLMMYTVFLPVKEGVTIGIIIFALIYLIRILRLLIIFINKNISIFYLILYLCGLEILPVLISVKYFSGLV